MKEEIYTLSELLQLDMNLVSDKCYFKVYFTEEHKKSNSIGFIPGIELKAYKELDNKWNKQIAEIMWKK